MNSHWKCVLFPTELCVCVCSNGGHTSKSPRLPDLCFPTRYIFLRVDRPAYFLWKPTDIERRGHSSKTPQWVHIQQQSQWKCECLAGSAGATPRYGHRKVQAGLAVWKGEPDGCCLSWSVDLSVVYLHGRTCEVRIHPLFSFGMVFPALGFKHKTVLKNIIKHPPSQPFHTFLQFQVEKNWCCGLCPLVLHPVLAPGRQLLEWWLKLDGHSQTQHYLPLLPSQLCRCCCNSQTRGSTKNQISKVRIWAVMLLSCLWYAVVLRVLFPWNILSFRNRSKNIHRSKRVTNFCFFLFF